MKNLDGKSIFTSDIAVLIYYACALVGIFTGFFGLVALIGAMISVRMAKKEGAMLVAKHCSWICNSIWFAVFAVFVVTMGVIAVLAMGDLNALEQANYADFEALLADPAMQSFLMTLGVGIIALVPVVIWYVYRICRGVLAVLGARAPK